MGCETLGHMSLSFALGSVTDIQERKELTYSCISPSAIHYPHLAGKDRDLRMLNNHRKL